MDVQHNVDNMNWIIKIEEVQSQNAERNMYDEKKDGLTNYVTKPMQTRYSSKLLLSQSEKMLYLDHVHNKY